MPEAVVKLVEKSWTNDIKGKDGKPLFSGAGN
jgi:hypothetical protein